MKQTTVCLSWPIRVLINSLRVWTATGLLYVMTLRHSASKLKFKIFIRMGELNLIKVSKCRKKVI